MRNASAVLLAGRKVKPMFASRRKILYTTLPRLMFRLFPRLSVTCTLPPIFLLLDWSH
jgi:hypothetical protein